MTVPSPSAQFEQAYFDQVYRNYARQNPRRKFTFFRRTIEAHLAGVAQPRILDVGCGPGSFLAGLNAGWRKYGIDVSSYAVRAARHRNPGASIVVGSASQLPFAGPFDVIVSFDVLEHLTDPSAAFDEIHSLLAPGGMFVFVVPVYDGLSGPIIRRLDRDPTHLHKHERGFWLRLAGQRFAVQEWHGLVRYLVPGGVYVSWRTRAFRAHTPAVAIVARRA